ncbi:MAG TPA: flagellar motor switch protein FliM [Gammaproteobacteria bacterium]|nr:flagellar motor switch protein FliM [Gammaproteobacteria bacterium]MEC8012224.1 flagellar motor switch protein FliM [Pseudomonadota bacterium]HBF07473.1 flagellar motor switch protein FliM [Gammaproteobacteria bacterium]HCK92391.1 flagellar motor switch protein FliM [Gammaproteobacteria bacterium]
MQDLLSQDEIDALLHGVGDGDIDTESDVSPDGVSGYDLSSQDRIVRGRMPTLEMINERFARYTRISLFSFLRRTADVAAGGVQIIKFSEYLYSLQVPTSLNLVRMRPLRGTGLFIFDAKLVFKLVDNFFGGEGRHVKIEGREFTPTENRVVQIVLEKAFEDMEEAWSPVHPVTFEYMGSEVNPSLANIVSPSEVVVVNTFHVELDGGGGDIHLTIPYSMLEPIREILDAGVQSDTDDTDERWAIAMREDIMLANVHMQLKLLKHQMKLRELAKLKKGDIIMVDMPEQATLYAQDVPIFKGKLGTSRGKYAVQIEDKIKVTRPQSTPVAEPVVTDPLREKQK